MDIRYCDQCGDVIQGASSPASLGSKVLCASCSGNKATQPNRPSGAVGQRVKTEEMRPPIDEIPQFTLSSVMRDDGLDLFSPDTIALRKQQSSAPKGASKLKLLDEVHDDSSSAPLHTGSVHVGGSRAGSTPQPAADTQRWTVHCGHCQAQLSIKPVSQRSRMRCPRCGGQQILDPAGTLQPIVAPRAAPPQQQVAQFDLGASAHAPDPAPPPAQARRAPPHAAAPSSSFGMNMEQTIQISSRAPTPHAERTMNIPAAGHNFADEGMYEEDSPTAIVAKLAGMVRGQEAGSARTPEGPRGPMTATRPGTPAAAANDPTINAPPRATATPTASAGREHAFLGHSAQDAPAPTRAQPPAASHPASSPGPAPRSFPILESESYSLDPREFGQTHDGPGLFTPSQTATHASPADTAWGHEEGSAAAKQLVGSPTHPETQGLQAEAVVLWVMIASLPTFAGLFLVSTAAGPEAHALIKTCGDSARAGFAWFLGLFT